VFIWAHLNGLAGFTELNGRFYRANIGSVSYRIFSVRLKSRDICLHAGIWNKIVYRGQLIWNKVASYENFIKRPSPDLSVILTRQIPFQWAKLPKISLKEYVFLLIRHSKYTAMLSKIHSYRLLFLRFFPLG